MADVNNCAIELSEIEKFNTLNLKDKYFKAVEWDISKWQTSGLNDSKFHRLVNSTKFWKRKLLEAFGDCNVILTLHAETATRFLSPQQIVDNIVEQFPGLTVESYNKFRNPRYLAIDFKDMQSRDFILDNLTHVGKFEVLFLSWAPINSNINIRVHWLPKRVPIVKVSTALGVYFNLKFVKLDTALHANGRTYGCGVSVFEGQLKAGVTLAQVPHIMVISGLEALITIPIRQPLCLQCDTVGHIAAQCPVSFCRQCRKHQPKEHVCAKLSEEGLTYAQKLTGVEYKDDDQHDYEFHSLQNDSKEEPVKVNSPAKRLNQLTNNISISENAKKVLRLDDRSSDKSILPGTTTSVGLQAFKVSDDVLGPLHTENNIKDLEVMDTSDISLSSQTNLSQNGFTTVQRKVRTARNKEAKDKEKATKVPIVGAHHGSKPITKPVTRSDLLANVLPKIVSVKPVPPGLPYS